MRRRNGRIGRNLGIEEPAVRSFDPQRGKHSRRIGPRVDADAVRPFLDLRRDGVAVDDDEPMIRIVEKETVPDPPQIGLPLLFESDSRPDSGMHEQIVPEPERIDERFEEGDMFGRNRPPESDAESRRSDISLDRRK